MKGNFISLISYLPVIQTTCGRLRTFEECAAGWERASPQSAPWGVGACGDHTPPHTHPPCSPSPFAGSGGRWRWTSPSSRRQRCNDTDRLLVLPLHHLLTAGLMKSQWGQDDASYYFSGMGNRSLGSTGVWLFPPPKEPSQPYTCTRLYIQALERTTFPAQFSRLGEMLCSNDILYHFLCYLQSTASFWSTGQRFQFGRVNSPCP